MVIVFDILASKNIIQAMEMKKASKPSSKVSFSKYNCDPECWKFCELSAIGLTWVASTEIFFQCGMDGFKGDVDERSIVVLGVCSSICATLPACMAGFIVHQCNELCKECSKKSGRKAH